MNFPGKSPEDFCYLIIDSLRLKIDVSVVIKIKTPLSIVRFE
jgi:hypothetical protein